MESSYTPRLILTGGDGLTYERMVQLKNYLQFHENTYERLDILEPILEIWHTKWTDLSHIYEAHWDSLTSNDPSSLGHSANKIKRKAPSNLKKVDYYPYSQLAYQASDTTRVPAGSPWIQPTMEKMSLIEANEPKNKRTDKTKDDEDKFEGDLVIAQSSHFIHDGMISRHATYAVANGDIGSVWECMKVRHFQFN